MQSHYIYAVLSNNIYNNSKEMKALPSEWKLVSSSTLGDQNFYAASYINESQKKIIIAFRGTVTLENKVQEDIAIFLNKIPPLFMSRAIPFVDTVIASTARQYTGFDVSFTGHSLGAILAELCAAKYTRSAVTFESLGTREMIDDMARKDQLPRDAPIKVEKNIFSYQAAISLINRINGYLGTRIRLYPDFSLAPLSIVPPLSGCDSLDMPTPGIFREYSFQQHHMAALLEQFDPVEGPLVYSFYPPFKEGGFTHALNTWLNYDENPYYWDKVIETIYFPICGQGQSLQTYKGNYTSKWLKGNTDSTQQTGVTINAPGSTHYPALTIWGTTNGKNTLAFGKGKFKVIAYGTNTYKVTRDTQVSCDVEQLTLDSKRESSLFIGDQMMQGYALAYTNLPFPPTLYLSNGLKIPWNRVASDKSDSYTLSMGGDSTASKDYASDFPSLRFTNSPRGQFNLLAGQAYRREWSYNPVAASSRGAIYSVNYPKGGGIFSFQKEKLTGEVIDTTQLNPLFMTDPICQTGQRDSFSLINFYEKEGTLNAFYTYKCSQKEKYIRYNVTSPGGEVIPQDISYRIVQSTNVLVKNNEMIFACDYTQAFCLQVNNFETSYKCCDPTDSSFDASDYPEPIMPLMRYSFSSGYSLETTNFDAPNSDVNDAHTLPMIMKKSRASVFDNNKKHLFDILSPLSDTDYHIYEPGAATPNDDTIIIGKRANLNDPSSGFFYALYLETSILAYFKLAGAPPQPIPVSAFYLPHLQQQQKAWH